MDCASFSARVSSVICSCSAGIPVSWMIGKHSRVAELGEEFDVAGDGDGDRMSHRTSAVLVCNLFCFAEGVMLYKYREMVRSTVHIVYHVAT